MHDMRQTGSRPSGSRSARLGPVLTSVWDRLLASDPGLLRLMMAVRGTVAVFLTTVAAMAAGRALGVPVIEFAAGITLSMMGPFLAREPTWRARLPTLLLLAIPAVVMSVGATALHGQGPVGDGSFLLLVFVGFLLQGRNPRWAGLGLVAVITAYVALFLDLPLTSLPVQVLSVGLGCVMTLFVSFVLVPLRPEQTLRRTVRALQRRAARVLQDTRSLAPGSRRLRTSLARLNEAALAADDQLSLLNPADGPGLRAHIMDLELATARLAAEPLARAAGPAGRRFLAGLAIHERRLRRNRWLAQAARPGAAAHAGAAALADIARAASALGQEILLREGAAAPPGAALPGPLAWRIALRVTLASALAMGGGMLVSPQRWFWAVITTYVVFLNTRTRGDTIYKGAERLAGTLLGLVGGIWLADVLAGDLVAQSVVLLGAVFGMYYLFPVSYTLAIFCVTVLLGLLYSLLGAASEPLLVLRLEETAVGAVAAVLVAAFVLPVRTRDQVRRSGLGVLGALAGAVGACRGVLAGEGGAEPVAGPVQAMRAVDRQVADLRLALLPLRVGRAIWRREDAERSASALLDCVHWARTLAAAARGPDVTAAAQAGTIERRLLALAAGDRTVGTGGPSEAGSGTPVAEALARLDEATAALAERLAIGALHGFQLGD